MTDTLPLIIRSTTVSDIGYVRHDNQDSSFAGDHLVTVCDGMGGHAGGDTASTIAIRSLAHIESVKDSDPDAMATIMKTSIIAAHDAIVGKARRERKLSGMGTTVVALRLVQNYWVLAHLGDSRAYLLRDGKLIRGTKDHSYVQHLIDTGRINEEEAKSHPQRNVVMRVLGDFDIDPRPDISIRKALPSDRWLLCSDGLCGVLEDETIRQTMEETEDLQDCAQKLVSMALKAGSTDNVSAVLAEAVSAKDAQDASKPHQVPLIGGAASKEPQPIADIIDSPVAAAPALKNDPQSPASRAAALAHADRQEDDDDSGSNDNSQKKKDVGGLLHSLTLPQHAHEDGFVPETGEIPIVQKDNGSFSDDPHDPQVAEAVQEQEALAKKKAHHRSILRRVWGLVAALLVLAALAGAGVESYRWSQNRYYVGEADGVVAIYRGVPTNIFGFSLSHVEEKTTISVSSLPSTWRDQLEQGIPVDSLAIARNHTQLIKKEAEKAAKKSSKKKTTTASPSPSPSKSGAKK